MFFLLPLVGVAVGAVAGAFTTHAAGEKDRQAAKHHRQIANDLSVKYSNLQIRYNEYSEKSKQQINELTQQNALNEAEKDLLRLAIRLQQCLYTLMWDIDESPTQESLKEFEKAVLTTNTVLFELKEDFIQVPEKYFSRNLKRVNEVIAELPSDVLKVNIYPVKQCPKCGQKNRITPHNLRLHPICGNCRANLITEISGVVADDIQDTPCISKSVKTVCETFATYKEYLGWFKYKSPNMKPFSENEFYKSLRYQPEINSYNTACEKFTTYENYLKWFRHKSPNMKVFSESEFYKSLRYQSHVNAGDHVTTTIRNSTYHNRVGKVIRRNGQYITIKYGHGEIVIGVVSDYSISASQNTSQSCFTQWLNVGDHVITTIRNSAYQNRVGKIIKRNSQYITVKYGYRETVVGVASDYVLSSYRF